MKKNVKKTGSGFETIRKHLTVRLHQPERIKELLPSIPHRMICDMAEVVCVYLKDKDKDGFLTVTNEMLNKWGIDEEELFSIALGNTVKRRPASLRPLFDILMERGLVPEGLWGQEVPERKVYVATNKEGLLGAGVILYPGFLADAAKKIGCSFFLIPSSVHELLFLPDTGDVDVDAMSMMIREVNENQVSPEEWLSDHPYRYDRETRCLTSEGTGEKKLYSCA